MRVRAWLKEPLVHFLLAGAAIFALFAVLGEPVDPADRTIEVDRERQALIALDFERTMQRPPTDAELAGLVDRWVREEVLYREALRLGLDRGDPVVRRRLANKMDFLASSQADLSSPDDAELREWYADNAARFADGGTVGFEQAYYANEAAARAALGVAETDSVPRGQLSALPREMVDAPLRDVEGRFGRAFAEALGRLDVGDRWQGPVQSGLGWHLVRLRHRETGAAPPFGEVREQALAEWRLAEGARQREAAYRVLADAYTVEIAE